MLVARRRPIEVLICYFLVSIVVFGCLEGWSAVDSIYFTATVFTTVGYGDLSPKHPVSRLFSCFYVLSALALLASFWSGAVDQFVREELDNAKALLNEGLRWTFPTDEKAARPDRNILGRQDELRRIFARRAVSMCLFIALTTIITRLVLPPVDSLLECFYFSIITLTTVGLGDIVPVTPLGKLAISALCVVGVPLFGRTLASFASVVYGGERRMIAKVKGGLTKFKLMKMRQFCEAMHRRGLYPITEEEVASGEHKITPFEFCCYLLMQNQVISMAEMDLMLQNFRELDLAGDGFLWSKDLAAWEQRRELARGK